MARWRVTQVVTNAEGNKVRITLMTGNIDTSPLNVLSNVINVLENWDDSPYFTTHRIVIEQVEE